VDQGELVTPGTPVLHVVNTNRVKITAGVPERYVADIRQGTSVEVHFSAYSNQVRVGQITFVGSMINPKSRSFPIEIELNNPEGNLKPEMVADLTILRKTFEDAIVLPQTAILRDERGPSVFVVQRGTDGQARVTRNSITVGPSVEGQTVIESGLEFGDEVVVVGQANLTEDDAVDVLTNER